MNLSDQTIKEYIKTRGLKIEPFNPAYLNPASYDFSLNKEGLAEVRATGKLQVLDPKTGRYVAMIDPLVKDSYESVMQPFVLDPDTQKKHFIIFPGEFKLAAVNERLQIPNGITAQLAGKSSLARLGLFIHITAGLGDPGWAGYYVLELFSACSAPVRLTADMLIAQVVFTITHMSEMPYNKLSKSKYQNQKPGQGSLYYENEELLND